MKTRNPFNMFACGWCAMGAFNQAILGNGWFVLIMVVLAFVNFYVSDIGEN